MKKTTTMGDVKNLTGSEAHEKVRELGMEIKTCMFCTYRNGRLISRPMTAKEVDGEGNIWFLSSKESGKDQEVNVNPEVDILFSHGHDKFLSVHGRASLSSSKQKIKELWDPIAKIWFTEGVDDPRISVIKVVVDDGYYWDTKHGKMVEMAKMAAALVTGKTIDDGIQGKVHL